MATLEEIQRRLRDKASQRDTQRPANEPCPLKNPPILYVMVARDDTFAEISGINVEARKTPAIKPSQKSGGDGIASFDPLKPVEAGPSQILALLDANQKKQFLPPQACQQVTTAKGKTETAVVLLSPLLPLKVNVIGEKDNKPVNDVELLLDGRPNKQWKTAGQGTWDFEALRPGKHKIGVRLLKELLSRFDVPDPVEHNLTEQNKELTIKLPPVPIRVYLRLSFLDPEGKERPFPKGFEVGVRFNDDTAPARPQRPQVLDDQGSFNFDVLPGKTWFTLKFDVGKLRYLVFRRSADQWVPDVKPVLEDPGDAGQRDALLQKLTLDGLRFLSIPKAWKLANAEWDAKDITVPANGQVTIPAEGLGSSASPGKLTLKPKYLHARFEFHDRKFGLGAQHGKKRVSIPPVPLQGWHSDRTTALDPANPGDPDTLSNWDLERSSLKKACQALPWIVTKKDDGTDRPALKNTMLLQFGWEKAYVFSKTDFVRQVVVLDPDPNGTDAQKRDAKKLAPGLQRPAYYDLPKVWKSANYYTRLDDSTGKFFDELTEDEIKAACEKTKPLRFSLDDIVLVANDGTQLDKATMDKNAADADKALSADSRVALLWLDPDDKFKVKVLSPRDKAGYFSQVAFKKEKDPSAKYRNVIVDHLDTPTPAASRTDGYPLEMVRVVVFCSGFYDVFDKRTSAANFVNKQVVGARAAKLNDAAVSVRDTVTATRDYGDYAAGNCGNFSLHFLQYAGVDAANSQVLFALVTYWNCRLKLRADGTATANDVTAYREKGMENAMGRWNGKDYEFRLTNRTDLKGKFFALFEAKLDGVGGKHICMAEVVQDGHSQGSWMAADTAILEKSTCAEEPGYYEAETADYDGVTYKCLTVSHEFGHATGLDDEYVYSVEGFQGLTRYEQYYPGMPYVIDRHSIMYHCQAPRLRHCWGRAAWLNAQVATLPGCSNADQNKLELVFPGKDLHYSRPGGETLKDVYQPKHTEAGYDLRGGEAKVELHLYRLGDDEFSRNLQKGPYKGILVASPRISARFKEGAIGNWVPNFPDYKDNDLVLEGGKKYVAKADHASSASFATDRASKWIEVADKGAWAPATAYSVSDIVERGGAFYYCNTAHTSARRATHAAKWWGPLTTKGAYDPTRNYVIKDLVTQGGNQYACTQANVTGPFDAGKWAQIKDRGAWQPKTEYAWGDAARDGAQTWFCQGKHTSAGFDDDAAKWLQVHPKGSWTDQQKRDWLGDLNKAIVNMLEGNDGKFHLAATAANEFSKSYLRVLPLYEIVEVGQAAAAGTHFTLEVKRDDSNSFTPVASAIAVGDKCDNKKIVRYLFGQTSNDTTALTAAELTKLATWMGTKAGGTWEVKTI